MAHFHIIFSTRTLVQIITILAATLLMKLVAEGYDLNLIGALSQ